MNIQNGFYDRYNVPSEIIKVLSNTHELIISEIVDESFFDWFNYNLTRIMTEEECTQYANYASELVEHILDKENPRITKDTIPGKSIQLRSAAFAACKSSDHAARAKSYKISLHLPDFVVGSAAAINSTAAYAAAESASIAASYWDYKLDSENDKVSPDNNKEIDNKIMEYGLKLLEE